MLPPGLRAVIDSGAAPVPPIFKLMQELGSIETAELYATFNMGIGLMMVVAPEDADQIIKFLAAKNEKAYLIGEIVAGERGVSICHP